METAVYILTILNALGLLLLVTIIIILLLGVVKLLHIITTVRFNCPIYTYEFIMESAGVVLDGEKEEGETKPEPKMRKDVNSFSRYSLDDLNEMLSEVLGDEDYEKAAKIRDEINRRKVEGD